MSIKVIEEIEKTLCVLCGEHLCFEKGYGPEFRICSYCAGEIVHLYDAVHGGVSPGFPTGGAKPVPQSLKWKILRRDGFKCVECGCESRPLHVDHIVPRAKGGGNFPENLQTLCDKCNLRKGAK
jgi:hypothetical protein